MRSEWALGEEYEIAPGNYARWIKEHAGWRIWAFENSAGTYYSLNKAAEGKVAPLPLGVAQAFFGATPYAAMHVHGPRPWISINGRYGNSSVKYRVVGDRFMKEAKPGVDISPAEVDGKTVEVVVISMPGPKTFSKAVQEQALIDMSGALDVLAMAEGLLLK